jgi:Mg-chelatase subunit ChlD
MIVKLRLRSLTRVSASLFPFALLTANFLSVQAAETKPGVAVAIVYDTSGSMQQKVRDADGRMTAKNIIAARALGAVLDRLEAVSSGPSATPETLEVGLVSFQGDHAAMALPCRPFNAKPFREWLKSHNTPQRGTPLGDSVRLAGDMVLKSALPRKHVLVITDGINTKGPDPTATIPGLQHNAKSANQSIAIHFVAFDVNAHVFDGVKHLGATVVGAVDEKQLGEQLEYIVEKKILLEEEEPPATKPKSN